MTKGVETNHTIYADTVKLEPLSNDFEASFAGIGQMSRHYSDDRGFDMLRKVYVGEIGINPGIDPDSQPVFWIETSEPEDARTAREATLADAIRFSEPDLLKELVSKSVKQLLNGVDNG